MSDPPFRTPISRITSDDEVYQLCRQWIRSCGCVDDAKMPEWYPTRLIDLEELRLKNQKDKNSFIAGWENTRKVRLVSPAKDWQGGNPGHPYARYVTLSHCWGKSPKAEHQLTVDSEARLREGVNLKDLPKTFRDAICFAARLPQVGFIWIDSLCIIQRDVKDWLKESATMEKVYSNTFLNISATHSDNMEGGLFRERDPESLLEDEVILNVAGLPGLDPAKLPEQGHPSGYVDPITRTKSANLRRCTILDLSFWKDRVNRAPVNRRGWVLQERLSAPRVLHFCEDQVAWECREFDAAEGQPQDVQILQLASNGVLEQSKLRGFGDINADGRELGKRIRLARLAGIDDPDSELPGVHALELWGRIVEEYSMTAITQPQDKLIALSGIARRMSRAMKLPEKYADLPIYVAGLWTLHIESQLLWFVEPDFQESDGSFRDHSTAPGSTLYRAPSFSWAAVDANEMRGIKYAEITNKDLLIEFVGASVTAKQGSDIFGLLDDARLTIRGKLRKATIDGPNEKGRYSWNLVDREDLDDEQHRNVYLDCPTRDKGITGPYANIYVVPVARGSRLATKGSKYMICLLLQSVLIGEDGVKKAFRRIGLTKLSPWADSKALEEGKDGMAKILVPHERDGEMPHLGPYNSEEGTLEILLV
jgi:hypothetical protein